jgi:Kelch motif
VDGSSGGSDAGYTPPSGWTTGATMPTIRTELAAAELDSKIYVAGGYGGLHAFEAYDPHKDEWATLKDMQSISNIPPSERDAATLRPYGGRLDRARPDVHHA